MNRYLTIRKGDDKYTRKSKRFLKKKIKRQNKRYINPFDINLSTIREDTYYNSSVTYSDEIERFCALNNISRWSSGDNTIKLDETFSLYENPNKVLKQLLQMLLRAKTSPSKTNLQYAGKVSFGALYMFDNFCWEIGKRRLWEVIARNISESEHEKLSMLRSFKSSQYDSQKAFMINERVRINRTDDRKALQAYKVKSKEITDMVQRAIQESCNDPDYKLPFEVHQTISSTIGEHFDNIILHAPMAEIGILCGFYDKERHEVTILIYNFGKTIYETLVADELPQIIKDQITEIVKIHSSRNFYEFKNKFTPENALTLLSLQEGISSRVVYDRSRGHGLTDFVEHCFNLNKETRIVLISGNTAIRIDKKYQIVSQFLFDRDRRVIAMNSSNDLYEKPDPDYVINLDVTFPGVIIETSIPLSNLS